MLTGFEVIARPHRARDHEDRDEAPQQPMRPERRGEQRRAPSTDQKKIRHQQRRKTAAEGRPCPECGSRNTERTGAGVVACNACGWEGHPEDHPIHAGGKLLLSSRRIAAVSYTTTIDDVLRSTDA